uniref:Uncharacterized protein n=1 Tax=Oryza glumipatula TaxID=40148 RepID=A0A0D9Y9F2_9ORYZ
MDWGNRPRGVKEDGAHKRSGRWQADRGVQHTWTAGFEHRGSIGRIKTGQALLHCSRTVSAGIANQLTNILRDREKCQYNGFRKLCSMINSKQLSPL